jgi:large subunit ribosomal protein L2
MAIQVYRPTTPGRRQTSVNKPAVDSKQPERNLLVFKKKKGGRNNQGKITVFHQGGGARRYVRMVDFKRDKYDVPAKVVALEYDPGRGATIALVEYEDKEKRYILAPEGMKADDTVISSLGNVPVKVGNRTKLVNIPAGETVFNIEMSPGLGGKMVRGAGMSAAILAFEGKYAQIKLPSSEIRMVLSECSATIGTVSNSEHGLVRVGSAGRSRHKGIRPTVRGKAKNPVDHPHGGGEGHNPIGMKAPKTPWGKPALGVKTRKSKKKSSKLILQRRKK